MTSQLSQRSNAVHSLSSLTTDIVVDLGCCSYQLGNRVEDSIQTLIRRFKPAVLFGFDPHPALTEKVGTVYGATVITSRRAAWTHDGVAGLTLESNCTHIDLDEEQTTKVFDLASWIRALPDTNIVLKMDVEGAEYVLLPHLIEQGLMDRFSRVLVEWHEGRYAHGWESAREPILAGIPCEVEEWQ